MRLTGEAYMYPVKVNGVKKRNYYKFKQRYYDDAGNRKEFVHRFHGPYRQAIIELQKWADSLENNKETC